MNHVIFILCMNQAAFTEACIDSVLAHTNLDQTEVFVFDNGSKDHTPALLRSYKDKIKYRLNGKNIGVFKAMNWGFRYAADRTFTILANDHIVTDGWFDALVEAVETTPGIYSPLVADYPVLPILRKAADKRNQLRSEMFRNKLGDRRSIELFMQTMYEDGLDRFAHQAADTARTCKIKHQAWPGLQIIHPDVIKKIGYMDERFGFHFGADIDFIYRAKMAGFPCHNVYSYVHHFGSITLRKAIGDFDGQSYRKDIGSGGTEEFFQYKKKLIKIDKVNEYELDDKIYRNQL